MLTKAFWFTVVFTSGCLLINALGQLEIQSLKELFQSIIIALILQPWIIRQFE